jgi:hypothetical protein
MSQNKSLEGLKQAIKDDFKKRLRVYLFTIPLGCLVAYFTVAIVLNTPPDPIFVVLWTVLAYAFELLSVGRRYYKAPADDDVQVLKEGKTRSVFLKGTITILSTDKHYVYGSVSAQDYVQVDKTASNEFLTQLANIGNKLYVLWNVIYEVAAMAPVAYFWVFALAYYIFPESREVTYLSDIIHPEMLMVVCIILLIFVILRCSITGKWPGYRNMFRQRIARILEQDHNISGLSELDDYRLKWTPAEED